LALPALSSPAKCAAHPQFEVKVLSVNVSGPVCFDGDWSIEGLVLPLWADSASSVAKLNARNTADCVEKLCLIAAPGADSFSWGARDSADDGRTAGDAGGAVLATGSGGIEIRLFSQRFMGIFEAVESEGRVALDPLSHPLKTGFKACRSPSAR
jgi:hypothetical protein